MLPFIDTTIVIIYIVFVFYLGIKHYGKKEDQSASDFLLGGRRLTLPAFVATLVTTWYGGILGVGEFSYRYGISNWLVFGVPYYVSAIIFALFIAKKAQRQSLYTIPQQLDRVYGRTPSLLGAFFVFIYTTPAAYILMLGVLLQFFFNWPLWLSIIIGALFSMIYVYAGGFRSVVKTDILQFVLMFSGFLMILIFCVIKFGGLQYLKETLPARHFIWHGGQGAGYIIMWFFIALSTLTEPAFYQRCFAAKDESVVKKGILVSVIFWICFDFLTTFTGLYARASLPNLANPVSSYLDLANAVLPPVLLGLFFTGLIATIMSTVDSYSLLAAMTIGRDYLWRLIDNKDETRIQFYTRIGLIISAVAGIIIAIFGQSVVTIWKELGSISTPALLIPVISSFSKKWRMRPRNAGLTIVMGAAVSFLWSLTKTVFPGQGNYLFQLEPIYPGLLITVLIYLADKILLSKSPK
ncbi:sodium:solute symporter family protein [candidate division KSB1 bacterium]|nr:sodium:solute symporter family protein [candidate division KSB1 bacterium]